MSNMPPANDLRARKRAELGLSPQRPTAKFRVVRPPDPAQRSWTVYLLPIGLVLIMGITIFLMFGVDKMFGVDQGLAGIPLQSDWSWARLTPPDSPLDRTQATLPSSSQNPTVAAPAPGTTALADVPAQTGAGNLTHAVPRLLVSDNFSQASPIFAGRDVGGQWRMEHIPQKAIYRMEVWPGHVAWTLLDPGMLALDTQSAYPAGNPAVQTPVYRMQTGATVAAHTPWGYAGLVTRVVEDHQLILFAVDGRGRYTVQFMRAGITEVAVPWTAADALNPAGTGNVLTVEDDGVTLRFFGNQFPLFQMNATAWEAGSLGIAAGALREGVGETRFEWFQLYGYEEDDHAGNREIDGANP